MKVIESWSGFVTKLDTKGFCVEQLRKSGANVEVQLTLPLVSLSTDKLRKIQVGSFITINLFDHTGKGRIYVRKPK